MYNSRCFSGKVQFQTKFLLKFRKLFVNIKANRYNDHIKNKIKTMRNYKFPQIDKSGHSLAAHDVLILFLICQVLAKARSLFVSFFLSLAR